MKLRKILVWFRNDLRLHDNEVLNEAIAKSDCVLPVFIFDPRQFEITKYGTQKTGNNRAQFLLESVHALRNALQQIGGNLLIEIGKPEEVLPRLVKEYAIAEVYHHREVAAEETAVSTAVEDGLWKLKVNLKHFIGHTLYNKEDLPFPIKDIPDVFNQFKKKTEREAIVKPCFKAVDKITVVEGINWGDLPSIENLGLTQPKKDYRANFDFEGGENKALQNLAVLINLVQGADKQKLNGLVSKLSAWLATGCISPRRIYWAIKSIDETPSNKAFIQQIILGLLWRDYFRFMFKKYGNTFFKPEGFQERPMFVASYQLELLEKWKNGQTGYPIVDAIMKELNATGYISNAARQTTAAFLVFSLKVNWIFGAAYFEEKLIDYCPASNWGNWANFAGVGNDKKSKFTIDLDKQIKNIDPKGLYVATWG